MYLAVNEIPDPEKKKSLLGQFIQLLSKDKHQALLVNKYFFSHSQIDEALDYIFHKTDTLLEEALHDRSEQTYSSKHDWIN